MKKIDFGNLKVEIRIGEYHHIDARKELGNVLFGNATTLEVDQLARKVFNAPKGVIDIDDPEYELLIQSLQAGTVRFSVINAIKEGVREVAERKISKMK